MKKRIGILGGISAQSTAKYYDYIIQSYFERKRDYHYPEIVIFSLDFQKFTDFENATDKAGYIKEIMHGIESLQNAGAEFIIIAANSPHAVFEGLEKQSRVPLLSIVEVTAKKAGQSGLKRLLLMGIKFTMQSSFYQDACEKLGIHVIVPSDEEQNEINGIVFDELVIGIFNGKSRNRLLEIINRYDVDGVILGCTELPLILQQKDTDIKLLDTLKIHAEAALDYSLTY